jgi:very-short-patch-repair endonuclease
MDADRARDRALTVHGWRPLRVTHRDLVPALAQQFAALGVRVASPG